MSYIGLQPTVGSYSKLDNLAPLFDGTTTTFTLQVGGFPVVAGSPQNLLISIDGVLQEPGVAYTVFADQIQFGTAPASGQSFFGIRLGHVMNLGTPSDPESYVRTSGGQTISGDLTIGATLRTTVMLESVTPTNSNVTATATAASLLSGIRTGTPTTNINLTLPTGTNTDAAFTSLGVNQSFRWCYINLAAATHTVTILSAAGHTVVGDMVVQPNSSAGFLTRKTGTNTFVTYRIA